MRKASMFKMAVLAMGIVVLAASVGEAQRRQRGQRGQRSRGRPNPLRILDNEYLQKELMFTSAQKKRLKEISLQVQGTRALTTDAVVQELGISDSQKEKINKAQEEARTKQREAFRKLFSGGGKRPSREEMTKKFREMREQSDKAVLSVLTKSQLAKFEKMKGKPFDTSKLQRSFFGGRRRGRPGGGNRPQRKRPDV